MSIRRFFSLLEGGGLSSMAAPVVAIAACLLGPAANASFPGKTTVSFPVLASLLREHRGAYCPDCPPQSPFFVCGSPGINPDSKHFRRDFFRRPEQVGYLLHHIMPTYLFAYELRRAGNDDFREKIRDDLAQARLIAVRSEPLAIRVSRPPKNIELQVPQTLAECLRDGKSSGCEPGNHLQNCCETAVVRRAAARLTWEDPVDNHRLVALQYRLWPDETLLYIQADRGQTQSEHCLVDEQVYFE